MNNRRHFLKYSLGASGLAVLATPVNSLAEVCGLTPPQTSGPFYPGEERFSATNDLTIVPGHLESAKGQVIYVRGKVVNEECEPIENANVEIWQACASGKYNNSRDPNPAPLDPHFKYWGETFTDLNGEYWFKTIVPGAYPASDTWDRPPHIHFRISKRGHHELITQMYFKGHPLNPSDLILRNLSQVDQQRVSVEFKVDANDSNALTGQFDITLRQVR